ncbi:hypothetical protein GCM10023082_09380 [Streptomyces tremellae]|uniref:Uncharacterized protein n=1 Tax=Streptomyces tremellae TaxID=1124239 RepID=A0ABP7E5C3_9ACTN
MVLPPAERLLGLVRRDGLTVDPGRSAGTVELDGLMEVSEVRVVRSREGAAAV